MTERICLVPRLDGVGGMVSFRRKLAAGLAARGIEVSSDLSDRPYRAVLVIGGTRQVPALLRARRRGARIVQRLDGMNWVHRQRPSSLRHSLRAEYGNWLLELIRSRVARHVVYQSEFSRRWWERVRGATRVPHNVVYNGVDLETYTPAGGGSPPEDCYQLLLVEGSLMGGYELGLETAVAIGERLDSAHSRHLGKPVMLTVAGRVAPEVQERWRSRASIPITWTGVLPPERIPELDRSAHLLYAADINAACPNSVIEALACGTPVLAYDTGALGELLGGEAGRLVAYGGDPWQLDPPDIPAAAEAAADILLNQERYRQAARQRAAQAFSLETMVAGYLEALLA